MTAVVHRSIRPPSFRHVEPAGDAHFNRAVALIKGFPESDSASSSPVKAASATAAKGGGNIPLNITPENIDDFNYYQRLGLDPLGISVGPEQVKRAYHKALLTYHPDKTGRGDEDEVFLGIQSAHDTLSNEVKRRAYDSQNEFDETIPSGNEKGADFYALYGPVFHLNSRFAVKLPVPVLGDESTEDEEVFAFYDYWEKFESWRDFTLSNQEHDPEAADSREEKRWMVKENLKGVKNLKKKDNTRIITLVDRARTRDPRVKKALEKEKADKKAAKEAKWNLLKAKEDEEKAKVQAAADAKADEEAKKKMGAKELKAGKDAAKKSLRRLRSILRRLVALAQEWTEVGKDGKDKPLLVINEWDVDSITENIGPDNIPAVQALIDEFGPLEGLDGGSVANVTAMTKEGYKAGLTAVSDALADAKGEQRGAAEAAAKAKEDRRAAEVAQLEEDRLRKEVENRWTKDELSWLSKATRKVPAGSANRWEAVAQYINQQMRDVAGFKLKDKDGCLRKYTQIQSEVGKEGAADAAAAPPGGGGGGGAGGEAAAGGGDGGEVSEGADALWDKEHQTMLEQALKKFPPTMEKAERWAAVAKEVEGKNKKQCIQRFKFLREKIAATKKK
mmetsp:Transcript_16961/g.33613  ORF Transcript_16961/g.33613 Transcript_16961/m.33613 type:complete len:618 (-) Transcript_16961:51-1904(-)|eukprot:CAMPEP_0171867234 /NCGR_PEP_ID=MMETSP0992-20121227/30741_1 /TAXON_ID=483369 /ORGANISM="non described non described, Strain CCMP2098" /LENGTH=617 /DNA_ID=CAMNT_0012490777 /DNA_START=37 /DNA_END=1890 /DNA_ORIENTATION=-